MAPKVWLHNSSSLYRNHVISTIKTNVNNIFVGSLQTEMKLGRVNLKGAHNEGQSTLCTKPEEEKMLNIHTLTNRVIDDFSSFQYSDHETKQAFVSDFLHDAKAYCRNADRFNKKLSLALWFSNAAIVLTLLLQVFDQIPLWIPGWYFAFLFHGESYIRLPQISARLDSFMRTMKATPATSDDYGKSDQIMGTTFVVWLVGGFLTGEWEVFAIGTSICAFFGFTFVVYEYRNLIEKNRKAYKKCGDQLVKALQNAA